MTNTTTSPTPVRQLLASQRVYPATPADVGPTTTTLSILDATVTRFSPCAAIWLYDAKDGAQDTAQLFDTLEKSLSQTLNDYPHFAGQLRWAPGRHGRPQVTYGTDHDDPGVELVLAHYNRPLSAIVPSNEARQGSQKIWLASDFPQDELLSVAPLAFLDLSRYEGLPGVSVQLTAFEDGGWAVGVRMTHCLGDAICLVEFVKRWAVKARVLSRGCPEVESAGEGAGKPIFNPGLLDRQALNLDLDEPSRERIAMARGLPMHRYDWWDTEAPGCPSWAKADTAGTKPSEEALQKRQLSPATPPPWLTWDLTAPVDHVQIRFSADQVRRLKSRAQASLVATTDVQRGHAPISRLDSLLAHVWLLINRARQLQDSNDQVFMNLSLGVRTRVSPPLPSSFVGSPILIGHVSATGQEACSASLGSVALYIRQMMSLFTPDAVAAYLHDAAYEASPQRLWQAFLGSRHTLVTAWTRAGVYEVDFVGDGRGPSYVQARMPRMDGLLQVLDVGQTGDFDVSLCLEREAMRRMLADESLWP